MNPRNTISLAVATILFSLVGILVKLIHLPSSTIAFARALGAALALLLFFLARRERLFVLHRRSDLLPLGLLGVLTGGNWYFYFLSIQVSTVAVAVISLFTYPLITALLEPLLLKKRYNLADCIGSLLVIAGVVLVVPRFELANSTTQGVLYGTISATSLALCNILNKKLVVRYTTTQMLSYQFAVAAVLFMAAAPRLLQPVPLVEIMHLVFLGTILTTFSLFLFINSFKELAASTASILTSLQPFLTVLFAYVFLREVPTTRTLAGGAIICATVVGVSIWHAVRGSHRPAPVA